MARHLKEGERDILKLILDACGPNEVLRIIGQYVAHNSPVLENGNNARTAINKAAHITGILFDNPFLCCILPTVKNVTLRDKQRRIKP